MNKKLLVIFALALGLGLNRLPAQFGPRAGAAMGPKFDAAMAKLFGENNAFSANLDFRVKSEKGDPMSMPGKMAFNEGKSRFEMNMAELNGGRAGGDMAAQMAAMGMDKLVVISRPDKKVVYMIYPGLKAYATTDLKDPKDTKSADKFTVEVTELGKETVEGQACVKNKVVVTDDEGVKHESTVWNATGLKKFPVRIQTLEGGNDITMLFKDVKLTKPESSLFDPPADFKAYDTFQAMLQEEMMKRMGGPGGPPPPR